MRGVVTVDRKVRRHGCTQVPTHRHRGVAPTLRFFISHRVGLTGRTNICVTTMSGQVGRADMNDADCRVGARVTRPDKPG